MLKKSIGWYLIFAMCVIAVAPPAEGAFSPAGAIALTEGQRSADLGKIQKLLESKVVSQRLHDLGYNADEAKQRLSLLSDQQLHNYAQHLDNLKVAGDDGIGVIIAVLVIIILIIAILHLTGHKVLVT